jgi:hypothetical protein
MQRAQFGRRRSSLAPRRTGPAWCRDPESVMLPASCKLFAAVAERFERLERPSGGIRAPADRQGSRRTQRAPVGPGRASCRQPSALAASSCACATPFRSGRKISCVRSSVTASRAWHSRCCESVRWPSASGFGRRKALTRSARASPQLLRSCLELCAVQQRHLDRVLGRERLRQ